MSAQYQLVVREGHVPSFSLKINKDEIHIGRGFDNDISIVNPDVSRSHARITKENDVFHIEDLGSTNGTIVNGKKISNKTVLNIGDAIYLGTQIEIILELVADFESTQLIDRTLIPAITAEKEYKKTHVFISYSRKNKRFVQKLHSDIVQENIKAWVDWEGIPLSADWWREIVEAIQTADAFIFIVSPDSLRSKVCLDEINKAVELNKQIVPVIYKDPDADDPIHESIKSANWVFMRTNSEYKNNLQDMVNILETDLEWVKEHTRLLVRAIDWEDSNRSNSNLLRGRELAEAETWLAASGATKLKPTEKHMDFIIASRQDSTNRTRRIQYITVVVFLVMFGLTIWATIQSRIATDLRIVAENNAERAVQSEITAVANENRAATQQAVAEAASTLAVQNQQEAEKQRQIAVEQQIKAEEGQQAAEKAQKQAELSEQKAQQEADRSKSSQLAAQSQLMIDQNAPLATILMLESLHLNADNEEAKLVKEILPFHFPPIHMFFSGHFSPVTSVDWSNEGILVSGSKNGEIFIWDLSTHLPAKILNDHTDEITDLDWSPDGSLASTSLDGQVIIWNLDTLEPENLVFAHDGPMYSIDWSEDGLRLAASGANNTIIIWSKQTGETFQTNGGHRGDILAVALGANNRLASGGEDNLVIVKNLSSEESEPLIFDKHTDDIRTLAWSPDNLLASGSDDSNIYIWNIAVQANQYFLKTHAKSVLSVDWSESGELISSAADNSIIIWNLDIQKPATVLNGHGAPVPSVTWGDPGHIFSAGLDETIIHWELNQPDKTLIGHNNRIRTVKWNKEGTKLTSGADDNRVIIWDPDSGNILNNLASHQDWVRSVAWSPDGRLASASEDGSVIIWDLQRNQSDLKLEDHNAPVYSVTWGPSNQLVSGDANGKIILWDLTFNEDHIWLEEHTKAVLDLSWHFDGKLASAGEDGKIIIWDLENLSAIQIFEIENAFFTSLSWGPDGRLAAGTSDHHVVIWDVNTGLAAITLEGHTDMVTSVDWNADGRLISGSNDNTLIYWDLDSGSPEAVLRGHAEEVTAVRWHPEGDYVISASSDTTIRILQEKFLTQPCEWGVRNLIEGSEWENYFPGQPYEETCQFTDMN